jgi:hypothetical protein
MTVHPVHHRPTDSGDHLMAEEPILAACRYCARTDALRYVNIGGDDGRHVGDDEDRYAVAVFCGNCHVTGPHHARSGWAESREAAAGLWNHGSAIEVSVSSGEIEIDAEAKALGLPWTVDYDANHHIIVPTVAREGEPAEHVEPDELRRLAAFAHALAKETAAYRFVLSDAQAVHLNMLRGGIAKPSRMNLLHLACATDYDHLKEKVDALEHRIEAGDWLIGLLEKNPTDPERVKEIGEARMQWRIWGAWKGRHGR